MNAEMEILIKIIVGACSVFGLMKIFSEISIKRNSDFREDFDFSIRFFNEYNSNENLSPILIEKGLKAVAGTRLLSASEILYLLRLKHPSKNINRYIICHDYLAFDEQKSGIKISYSRHYESKIIRIAMKVMFLVGYAISFLLVILPVMFFSSIPKFGNIITLILMAALLLYTAWKCLKKYAMLLVAEEFISEQELEEK